MVGSILFDLCEVGVIRFGWMMYYTISTLMVSYLMVIWALGIDIDVSHSFRMNFESGMHQPPRICRNSLITSIRSKWL